VKGCRESRRASDTRQFDAGPFSREINCQDEWLSRNRSMAMSSAHTDPCGTDRLRRDHVL
jgi:hypothetical protein